MGSVYMPDQRAFHAVHAPPLNNNIESLLPTSHHHYSRGFGLETADKHL